MAWTGATLVLAPLAIAGLISATPMLPYLRHVHREEDMLTERFGSAYAAYQLSDVPS
jgi:protein-S-isoprenylcysteine O-methyltransferase Ste14